MNHSNSSVLCIDKLVIHTTQTTQCVLKPRMSYPTHIGSPYGQWIWRNKFPWAPNWFELWKVTTNKDINATKCFISWMKQLSMSFQLVWIVKGIHMQEYQLHQMPSTSECHSLHVERVSNQHHQHKINWYSPCCSMK